MRLLLSVTNIQLNLTRAMSYKTVLHTQAFVNGQWVDAASGAKYAVRNPANGEHVCDVPDMSADDAETAIKHAQAAFERWRQLSPSQRAAPLLRWERLIRERTEDLAALITLENGKPLAESRAEIAYANSFVGWYAEEARRVCGQTLQGATPEKRIVTLKQPQGVCGMVTPWNFPCTMITRKACAALAAGCTVVVKPAEDTPLTALALCQLAAEAEIPPGAINIVTCSRARAAEVGRVLTQHPLVKHFSFTGSTATGKALLAQAASTVKRVTLELGGNASFIVFNSADVEKAVTGLLAAKFRNNGQSCVCPNRIFLQSGIRDAFLEKLVPMVAQMKVGDGFKEGVHLGPLINAAALQKLERLLSDAKQHGGRILTGGRPLTDVHSGGNYFEPTVISDLPRNVACFREEIFGPLIAVYEFKDESEVVPLANDVSVGLASYFYSSDVNQCWRVAEQLNVGMVGVNEPMVGVCAAPFGGWSESGLGSESGVGYGIDEYLNVKSVLFNLDFQSRL